MKKTFKTMLALMAGAMVFTACNKDDILENNNEQKVTQLKHMIFTADQEGQDGATRAEIAGTAINWSSGDKISIFDGSTENEGNQEFTLTSGVGKTSGTFEGEAADCADVYYALYPYVASSVERIPTLEEAQAAAGDMAAANIEFWKMFIQMDESIVMEEMESYGISSDNQAIILAYLKDETMTFHSGPRRNASDQFENVSLPAVQAATAGTADPKAMLMIGRSEDASTIQFKNVCAYVKVTPEFDCKAIKIISNGTQNLAGTVTLGYNEGTPAVSDITNGSNMVSLTGTITAGNTYYIAVLPATLNGGFTIRFVTTDAICNKSTAKALALTRNKVIDLGSLGTSDLNLVPITGTAEATIGGSVVYVNWVQLWENGPKFAEYNVGATSETDYGGYYTWGGKYKNGTGITWSDDHNTTNTGTGNLTGTDDTVTYLWGSNWRMPTKDELQALISSTNCTVELTYDYNGSGKRGKIITGNGDYSSNSVFLPAAGFCSGGNVNGQNDSSYYWSSTPGDNGKAYCLYATDFVYGDGRSSGFSVRAVLAE